MIATLVTAALAASTLATATLAVPLAVSTPYRKGTPLGGIPTVTIVPGVDMPLQGVGTWLYNNSVAYSAVLDALTLKPTPYVHVDTALIYGNQKGVGRALKDSKRDRKSYFITTKIPGGLNASATQSSLDQDLSELQLDYVDLMLVHYPCTMDAHQAGGKASRQTMWRVMEKFVKAGKARAIGVSHYCPRHLQDVLDIATIPIAVNQVQYHVGMGRAGAAATDGKQFAKDHGITYQSFSPLCGPCMKADGKTRDRSLVDGDLVVGIGHAHNKSGAQVSLRWMVQQSIPVIPKTHNPDHLRENIDLFDWELTAAEMAMLSSATSPAVAGVGAGVNATSGDCTIA